jgi:hypothetical protein
MTLLQVSQAHRRDALIEFIKGLLAVPFVLHSQPTAASAASFGDMVTKSHRRYREIMRDIEGLVNDHSKQLLLCYLCVPMMFTFVKLLATQPERQSGRNFVFWFHLLAGSLHRYFWRMRSWSKTSGEPYHHVVLSPPVSTILG